MIISAVRGKILGREEKIRALIYSENPIYRYDQILDIIQIPKRTYHRYESKIWEITRRGKEMKEKLLMFRKFLSPR